MKKNILPITLMVLLAVSRWPGLLPWNFSAVYGLMFCAGVYFPKRLVWWLPFTMMFITDLLLCRFYYHASFIRWEMLVNYVALVALVLLGRRYSPKSSWFALLGGGLLGAILFYLVTNTFSWISNPAYAKTLAGWIIALTRGMGGYPETWEFFRNTLMSGGLFTGLFVGAIKLLEAAEPEEKEEAESQKDAPAEQPEEAKA